MSKPFQKEKAYLGEHGLVTNEVTIADATTRGVHVSTKYQEKQKYPEQKAEQSA